VTQKPVVNDCTALTTMTVNNNNTVYLHYIPAVGIQAAPRRSSCYDNSVSNYFDPQVGSSPRKRKGVRKGPYIYSRSVKPFSRVYIRTILYYELQCTHIYIWPFIYIYAAFGIAAVVPQLSIYYYVFVVVSILLYTYLRRI